MRKWQWSMVAVLAGVRLFAQEVIERGPHFNVVEKTEATDVNGTNTLTTNRFTILQPGLNYYSEMQQKWIATSTQIDLGQVGASYTKGPFRLDFSPNGGDIAGQVKLSLPDGGILRIRTLGIALTAANGDSVWIGEIRDSNGFLDGNSIIYPEAFAGLKADLLIKVSVGKYENDVVIREAIDPLSLGFDPANCRLEVWHQILEMPQSESRVNTIIRGNGVVERDEQIDLGEMHIGEGTAFRVGADQIPVANTNGPLAVAKERFVDTETGITFLIESIPFGEAASEIGALPARQGAFLDRKSLQQQFEAKRSVAQHGKRRKPVNVAAVSEANPTPNREHKIVAVTPAPRSRAAGFVMDYTVLATASNFRFDGSTTYYVTNEVNLVGTTILEGGTVIKFPPNPTGSSTYNYRVNVLNGILDCRTSPYAPAVFTSDADNSVGDTISTNALSGYYGRFNLYFGAGNTNSQNLHDIRSCHAWWGLVVVSNVHNFSNLQIRNCYYGIEADQTTVNIQNILGYNNIVTFYGANPTYLVEHATVNVGHQVFGQTAGGTGSIKLTNSIVAKMTNFSGGVTLVSSTNISGNSGIFAAVGAGEHYLPEASPFRNAGTAVSTTTADILRRGTTQSPIVLTGTYTEDVHLSPRYLGDEAFPDLGYHYPIIDYISDGLTVTNQILSLGPGVTVAHYNGPGIWLFNSSSLVSTGLATSPNRFVLYSSVQEQPVSLGSGTISAIIPNHFSTGYTSSATIRFTEFSASKGYHLYNTLSNQFNTLSVSDSKFFGSRLFIKNPDNPTHSLAFTNNLFAGCRLDAWSTNAAAFFNNVFWHQTNFLSSTGTNLTFKDNAFNNTYIDAAHTVIGANDGFLNYTGTVSRLYPTNANDVVASSFSFANTTSPSGLTGYFYQSSTNLQNAGSRTAADATLYHYTTTTAQTKESSSTVDIGFHYIALDGSGFPVDTDGDGIPDYLEDTNGNGTADAGETNWQQSNGVGTGAADIVVFTPLQ